MSLETEVMRSEEFEVAEKRGYFEFKKPEGMTDEECARELRQARKAAPYHQSIINNSGAGPIPLSDYPLSYRITDFKDWFKEKYMGLLGYIKIQC